MKKFLLKNMLSLVALLLLLVILGACSQDTGSEKADQPVSGITDDTEGEEKKEIINLTGKMKVDKAEARIGDEIMISAKSLEANVPLKVVWADMKGSYELEENYSFIGTSYESDNIELLSEEADAEGNWEGTITIPKGFGDDHDLMIYQHEKIVAKANVFVETVFTMEPESGPIGTEITITGEGLSWKVYGSLWHLNYDNKYTGMITGVSTKGEATAVIRAAGEVGDHTLTIESGSSGKPYMNRAESAINYIHTQKFTFAMDSDQPDVPLVYVEDRPEPASGGIQLPDAEMKDGVDITLDKMSGNVGDAVTLNGSGLPANEIITLNWHTMVGNRVTTAGFGEQVMPLGEGTVETDAQGEFSYPFTVPEDLGGLPHLIDVKVKDHIHGQAYFQIIPSVVSIVPKSGPIGTEFIIEIKGSGWTEFDNALGVTYDNSSVGYICGFNSQGTIKLPLVASGNAGYHVIDIYPSIYKGQQIEPNLYLNPQLTYRDDHPGTGMPALRILYEVTED